MFQIRMPKECEKREWAIVALSVNKFACFTWNHQKDDCFNLHAMQ